jgi:PleD family two-component response regulator
MLVPSLNVEGTTDTSAPISAISGEGAEKRASRRELNKETRSGSRKHRNRVMIVGRIRELALYRAEVLKHLGFQVSIPQSKEEALDIIRSDGFDVAVLSYTLPSTVVQEIADEVREHCPDCRIVSIAETSRFDRRIAPDAVALAEEGPPALVAAIQKAMQAG